MSDQDRLEEALLRWDELHDRQAGATPADVCGDCPELLPELERLLRGRKKIKKLLGNESTKPPDVAMPAGTAPYQAKKYLAGGGLGLVFVAEDTGLRREVALKTLRPDVAHHSRLRQLFLRECQITSRLNHPGVAPVYGTGTDAEGNPFYAMRLIRGRTLEEELKGMHEKDLQPVGGVDWQSNATLRRLLRALIDACNTISYAHDRNIVHRDIKPANIMVGRFGETLVVDWGLAKEVAVSSKSASKTDSMAVDVTIPPEDAGFTVPHVQTTERGREIGSLAYMSPEAAQGDSERVLFATDVFSLGATLWAIVAGRARFVGQVTPSLKQAVRTGKYEPPTDYRPDVPAGLAAICAKAMKSNPDERYPSPRELADDLERWLADEPVTACPEPWWQSLHRSLVNRLPLVTGLAAAAVMAAVALGGIAWQGRSHSQELSAYILQVEAEKKKTDEANERLDQQQKELAQSNDSLSTRLAQAERALTDLAQAAVQLPELNDPASERLRRDLLEKALSGYDELYATEQLTPEQRHVRALIALRLGAAHRDWGDNRQAEQVLDQAYQEFVKLQEEDPVNRKHRFGVAVCLREKALMIDRGPNHFLARCSQWQAVGALEALAAGASDMRPDKRWDIRQVYAPQMMLAAAVIDMYESCQRERTFIAGAALPTDRATCSDLRERIRRLRSNLTDDSDDGRAKMMISGPTQTLSADSSWRRGVYRLVLARAEGDLDYQLSDFAAAQDHLYEARREALRLAKEFPTVLFCMIERARTMQLLAEIGYETRRWARGASSSGMDGMEMLEEKVGETGPAASGNLGDVAAPAANAALNKMAASGRLNLLGGGNVEEDYQQARQIWDLVLKEETPQAPGMLRTIYLQAHFARALALLRLTDAAFGARDSKPTVPLTDAELDMQQVLKRIDQPGLNVLPRSQVACACEELARYFALLGESSREKYWHEEARRLHEGAL